MTDELWLQNLKVGDRVVIEGAYSYAGGDRVDTVTKITATQIVCGGTRFRKDNGWELGRSWSRRHLTKPTTAILERIEERSLRDKIDRIAEDRATPLATLRAMWTAAKGTQP